MTVTEKAYAKINLTLEVLDKRADGYHNIESIMTTVNLYDTVTLTAHTGGQCRLTCDTVVTEKEEDEDEFIPEIKDELYQSSDSELEAEGYSIEDVPEDEFDADFNSYDEEEDM